MGRIAAGGGWRPTSGCFRCATFSEAIMKAILSMALVLGACGLAGAANVKAADPVGTWQCRYEIGRRFSDDRDAFIRANVRGE